MPFRQALLLYNPHARGGRNVHQVERAAHALRQQHIGVSIVATEGPGTAGAQATNAADNHDIIFACGGDGTVHEVLQGLAFHPTAALGILPMGTANALAKHLRLDRDPARAALQQIHRQLRSIPIGKVTYTTDQGERSRYFLLMAGAGVDGALVYKMLASGKRELGRTMYYLRAAALFASTKFATFNIDSIAAADEIASRTAVSAMCVRVDDLGGAFSPMVRGGSIEQRQLRLTVIKPPSRYAIPAWFIMSWLGLGHLNRFVETIAATEFHLSAGNSQAVRVQADGEWLGRMPMSLTLIPDGIRLPMPNA